MTPTNHQEESRELEALLTVDETAHLLRIGKSTVRRLLHSGALPGLRVGRQWRVQRDELGAATGHANQLTKET